MSMHTYVIERELPGAGELTPAELHTIATKSNSVIADLAPRIQWVQSYVTADKIYCIYRAESDELIQQPAHPYTQRLLPAVPNPKAGPKTAVSGKRWSIDTRDISWNFCKRQRGTGRAFQGRNGSRATAVPRTMCKPLCTGHLVPEETSSLARSSSSPLCRSDFSCPRMSSSAGLR